MSIDLALRQTRKGGDVAIEPFPHCVALIKEQVDAPVDLLVADARDRSCIHLAY